MLYNYMREKYPKFKCPKINNDRDMANLRFFKNGKKMKMFYFSHFNDLYLLAPLRSHRFFFLKTEKCDLPQILKNLTLNL